MAEFERLTRLKKYRSPGKHRDGGNYASSFKMCQVIERLAAYENTGFTPEEIVKMNDFINSQCAKLLAENGRLKKERDAAVADIERHPRNHLETCKRYEECFQKAYDDFAIMPCLDKSKCPGWQWRGVVEGE